MNNCRQNNFLQVSINSQKLTDFLSNIHNILSAQDKKIDQNHKQQKDLNKKTIQHQNGLEQLINRNNFQHNLDLSQLREKQNYDRRQGKEEIVSQLKNIQDKLFWITTQNSQFKDQLEMIRDKTNIAYQQTKEIKNIKSSINIIQQQLNLIQNNNFNKIIEQCFQKYHQRNQANINQLCLDNFFKIMENDSVRQVLFHYTNAELGSKSKANKFQGLKQKQQQRPNKKSLNEAEAMYYIEISQKLKKLQSKLEQKSMQQNKIVYPSNTQTSQIKKKMTQQTHQQQTKTKNMFNTLVSKVQGIQTLVSKKISQLKIQILKQNDKNVLFNQKISILSKKIQKQKIRINQILISIKKNTQKKVDDKLVQNFIYQLRKKTEDYQQTLQSKMSKDLYQKQKAKNNDKIKMIHQNLIEKADKSQIKKAMIFIESKIKQIIMLIAGSFDQDRTGTMKKTNYKCLSCDKELESKLFHIKENIKQTDPLKLLQQDLDAKFKKTRSTLTLRCKTSRMRSNILLNGATSTPISHVSPRNLD